MPRLAGEHQAYVKASNTGTGDRFGTAVALGNDLLVAGSPYEASTATGVNGDQTSNGAMGSGAAYVYRGFSGFNRVVLVPEDDLGHFHLSFYGIPGFDYRLERSPRVDGPWESITTQSAPPSGGMVFRDPEPLPGQAFYQVSRP